MFCENLRHLVKNIYRLKKKHFCDILNQFVCLNCDVIRRDNNNAINIYRQTKYFDFNKKTIKLVQLASQLIIVTKPNFGFRGYDNKELVGLWL